jgi:hypothetical protein
MLHIVGINGFVHNTQLVYKAEVQEIIMVK